MREKNSTKIICIILLISLTFIAIFPLLWAITSSLRPDTEIYKYALPFQWHTFIPVKFTLDSYKLLFTKFQFQKSIWNTLVASFVTVILSCAVNSVAAFGFTFFRFKGRKILYALVLVSFMVPFESIAIPLYKVVYQLNWINTFCGIIVPGLADGLVLFLFVQFFSSVPSGLFEAARIDGASWWQIYLKILLPISKAVIITAALMVFINQWNSFLWPLLVAHGRNIRLIQVALSDFTAEHVTLWSSLYAASVVSALIPLVLFLPFQKYYVEGITSGGIKG